MGSPGGEPVYFCPEHAEAIRKSQREWAPRLAQMVGEAKRAMESMAGGEPTGGPGEAGEDILDVLYSDDLLMRRGGAWHKQLNVYATEPCYEVEVYWFPCVHGGRADENTWGRRYRELKEALAVYDRVKTMDGAKRLLVPGQRNTMAPYRRRLRAPKQPRLTR